jgi:hypothetical protein
VLFAKYDTGDEIEGSHVALMEEKRNPCTMGNPEGKRPLEGHGRRRENNDTICIK